MESDLVEEIEFMIDLLAKSGFFSKDEILEILEDQFIEEDMDFSQFTISPNDFDNTNFSKLENVFNILIGKDIVAIHNCGYDIGEGVEDAFELNAHLRYNKAEPVGFCFYTFEDIEDAIFENNLKITFGDFEKNEKRALEIGKTVYECLNEYFEVKWDETVDSQIEINPFLWDKSYDSEKEYEVEGAFESFINRC